MGARSRAAALAAVVFLASGTAGPQVVAGCTQAKSQPAQIEGPQVAAE